MCFNASGTLSGGAGRPSWVLMEGLNIEGPDAPLVDRSTELITQPGPSPALLPHRRYAWKVDLTSGPRIAIVVPLVRG